MKTQKKTFLQLINWHVETPNVLIWIIGLISDSPGPTIILNEHFVLVAFKHRVRNAQCFSGNEITYFKLQYISHTTPKSFELKVVNEERARCLSVCLCFCLLFLVSKTVSYTVYTHSHIWDKVLQSIIQSGLTPNLGERSWSCNLRCLHRRRYSETN